MRIKLTRVNAGARSTIGYLSMGNQFLCWTLERPVMAGNPQDISAIPSGRYKATLRTVGGFHQRYSAKFPEMHRGMIWLRDIPGREYVLLHIGNRPEDTRGCILLGDTCAQNVTQDGFVGSSTDAYRRVYPLIASALERGEVVEFVVGSG